MEPNQAMRQDIIQKEKEMELYCTDPKKLDN